MESKEMLRKRSQLRVKELMSECSTMESQQEFADYCGISKFSLSQYVNGTNTPGNVNAAKIAKKMRVNPLWVMGFDVPKEARAQNELERHHLDQVDAQLSQEDALQNLCELHGIDIHGDMNYLHITFLNGQKYAITHEDWKFISTKFPKLFEDVILLIDKYPTLIQPVD